MAYLQKTERGIGKRHEGNAGNAGGNAMNRDENAGNLGGNGGMGVEIWGILVGMRAIRVLMLRIGVERWGIELKQKRQNEILQNPIFFVVEIEKTKLDLS